MKKIALLLLLSGLFSSAYAEDCIGSDGYSVCTSTSEAANGDTTISSYDTEKLVRFLRLP